MTIGSKAAAEISVDIDHVQLHVTITGSMDSLQDPAVMRDFVHQLAEVVEAKLQRLGGADAGSHATPTEDEG